MPSKPLSLARALGLRIKQLRMARGMTQEDLAEAAGLFRTYMSRVEAGTANPTLSVLELLARHLKVTPSELLLPPDPTQPVVRVRSVQPTSRGRVSGR
jgi:transcriptional regulator with XRE-family HTH domain